MEFGKKETMAEEIIEIIKKDRQGTKVDIRENNIYEGYGIINYEIYDIEKTELMNGHITMYMSKELAEEKYSYMIPPEYIYPNQAGSVNFTFILDERKAE